MHTLCIPSSTLRTTFVQDPSRVFAGAQPVHVPMPPQRNAGRHSTGTRASPSHLEAPGPPSLAPFSSHFPAQKKLTRHSVGLCHLRCQPISKTFSVLKISCFYSAFWVTCGTEGECAPAQRVPAAHHHPHLRRPQRGPHSEPWLSSCRAAGDMGSQAGGASVSSHHPGLHAALTSLPSSLGSGSASTRGSGAWWQSPGPWTKSTCAGNQTQF